MLIKFTWASFHNHRDMLLREFLKGRQKETRKFTTRKIFMKMRFLQQTKQQ